MLRVSVSIRSWCPICCDCFALRNIARISLSHVGWYMLVSFYPPSLLLNVQAAMTLEMPARKQVTPLRVSPTVLNACTRAHVSVFPCASAQPAEGICILYLTCSGRPISAAPLQVPSVQVPQTILVNDYLSCSDKACCNC